MQTVRADSMKGMIPVEASRSSAHRSAHPRRLLLLLLLLLRHCSRCTLETECTGHLSLCDASTTAHDSPSIRAGDTALSAASMGKRASVSPPQDAAQFSIAAAATRPALPTPMPRDDAPTCRSAPSIPAARTARAHGRAADHELEHAACRSHRRVTCLGKSFFRSNDTNA